MKNQASMVGTVEGSATPKQISQEPTPPRSLLSRQGQWFLFFSLMLFTCCFLPWSSTGQSLFDAAAESIDVRVAFIIMFTVLCVTPFSVSRPTIRPWFGIATAVAVNLTLATLGLQVGKLGVGAELARWLSFGLLILSANPAIVKAGDFAMRRLNTQSAEVFTHTGTILPGVHLSAQDLYQRVENEIRAREWPGVEFLRAVYTETGVLSHKREYLRIIRKRQLFDLCAASFGKDYFITLREAEIKPQLTFATVVIFIGALLFLLIICLSVMGPMPSAVVFGVSLSAGGLLLFNVLRMGLTRLDGFLMRTPVIGPIYETWFRCSTTYFQHDTRVVFLKLMDDLVKARVDEETSAKGITLLSSFEHQPLLDGLYKTSTRIPKSAQ